MAGKPAVKVTGAVEFGRAVRKMRGDLESPAFHHSPAEALRDRALDRVPRVSGDLASTIAVELVPGGAALVAGSEVVPYAGVIEYGWDAHGIEAQHYLSGDGDPAVVHDAYAVEVDELVVSVGRES